MILLALVACQNGWGGVSVGNPGLVAIDVAPTQGLNYRRVRSMRGTLDLVDCDGNLVRSLDDGELLGALGDHEGGTWCGLVLEPTSTMLVSGDTFDAELEVPSLNITGAWDVDGHSLVLELGSPEWLSTAEGTIDATHPDHDSLVAELQIATSLHYDDDDDGVLDDDEREPVGEGDDSGDDEDD
jgi:hypothetical protein